MGEFFTKLIGTLAVILVVSSFISGSDILKGLQNSKKRWKFIILIGLIGGAFGIYGNISGATYNGAIVSVRDMGPMLSGFAGGPVAGLIAGLIAGVHRLYIGGITAQACVVATCIIGTACGIIFQKLDSRKMRLYWAFAIGAVMELFHLGLVLVMVRPFSTALDIVSAIIVPFVITNAAGFTMMVAIMTFIEDQQALAQEKNKLQSELEVATVIQKSVLPRISERYPGRAEIDVSASMDTAKEVGGDFYDIFFVDKDRLAFVIADVSGKGIPAALFMMSAKQTLQACVRDIPDLSEAVMTANDSLCEGNEAEMFVTMWIGVMELDTGEFTYVNAGHNPPVLMKKDGAEYLKMHGGFVLGGMSGIPYKTDSFTLEHGEGLYLYTDGVTEAETSAHVLLGEEKLKKCLDACKDSPSESIIESVKDLVTEHVAGADQFDDITMLCLKRN